MVFVEEKLTVRAKYAKVMEHVDGMSFPLTEHFVSTGFSFTCYCSMFIYLPNA